MFWGYTRHRSFCTTAHVISSHFALSIERMKSVGWLKKIDYFKNLMPVMSRFSLITNLRPTSLMCQNFIMISLVLFHITRNSRLIFWWHLFVYFVAINWCFYLSVCFQVSFSVDVICMVVNMLHWFQSNVDGHIWDVMLVWRKGNIVSVLQYCVLMVHKGTSSSHRWVNCIRLWSCLI